MNLKIIKKFAGKDKFGMQIPRNIDIMLKFNIKSLMAGETLTSDFQVGQQRTSS